MIKTSPLLLMARPQDVATWVKLGYLEGNPPDQEALDKEIGVFYAQRPDVGEGRYIAWLENTPIARVLLTRLDNVIELRDFVVANGYLAEYGSAILQSIADVARQHGNILTIDFYMPSYSRSFLAAGFKENMRTRMMKSLAGYETQTVNIPEGIVLRQPIFDDEETLAEMAYQNYMGTADAEMVSSSPAQAAAIIRAMFHNDYHLLNPAGSFVAIFGDMPVGSVLLGDASRSANDPLAWIMDISIAPSMRGRGLGKALLKSAVNAAHEQRYRSVGLIVTLGNTRAQTLYSSLGFESYGDLLYEASLHL